MEDINIYQIKPTLTNSRFNLGPQKDLSSSIQQKGLLQPIIVRVKGESFEIVAGNRRYNACKSLGWRKIACHIVELDDKEAFEVSLIENIQRKSMTPIDEAHAFKKYVSDFGWGGLSELALKLGKSVSYISKRIKLLDLPSDVVNSINNFRLDTSIAEELYSIKDKSKQSELAQRICNRHLSLRRTRELIKDIRGEFTSNDQRSPDSITNGDYYEKVYKSFDKSIIALRIAMNRLGTIIDDIEGDNWIIEQLLMQHRSMLHAQIDLLIKEKKKTLKKFL